MKAWWEKRLSTHLSNHKQKAGNAHWEQQGVLKPEITVLSLGTHLLQQGFTSSGMAQTDPPTGTKHSDIEAWGTILIQTTTPSIHLT